MRFKNVGSKRLLLPCPLAWHLKDHQNRTQAHKVHLKSTTPHQSPVQAAVCAKAQAVAAIFIRVRTCEGAGRVSARFQGGKRKAIPPWGVFPDAMVHLANIRNPSGGKRKGKDLKLQRFFFLPHLLRMLRNTAAPQLPHCQSNIAEHPATLWFQNISVV